MKLSGSAAAIVVMACIWVAGCGGGASNVDELSMVPGLCFLHVHVNGSMDLGMLPGSLNDLFPIWLCDSLGVRGDFGVSLVGVNLTDLSPQLLFLSRRIGADALSRMCAEGFACQARETDYGYEMVTDRGSILGSISSRGGWTCLLTGNGSNRAMEDWLSMEKEESLAADTDLVAIAESNADITLLVSRNTISFLSVIPTGMLDRQQITYLNMARRLIADLGLVAARLSVDVTDEDPPGMNLELQVVRENSNITTVSAGFSDTGIGPDSLADMVWDSFNLNGTLR